MYPKDIISASIFLSNSSFNAEQSICITSYSVGADKTICLTEFSVGADETYCLTENPQEADRVIELLNSSINAEQSIYITSYSVGADKTICLTEYSVGADKTICLSKTPIGADETICILNATPKEKKIIIALMSLGLIIPKKIKSISEIQMTNNWTTFEETSIKGKISGSVKNGNIFETISGNIYEVSEYINLYEYEYNPKVTVLNKGEKYKLIIDGFDEPVICKLLENTAVGTNRYAPVSTGHWVSKKMNNGQFIVLEDNSKWEISSVDRIYTMLWLATESITVINRDGYYFLINSDCNNEKVMAIHLGN